jgi:hypothetical protein
MNSMEVQMRTDWETRYSEGSGLKGPLVLVSIGLVVLLTNLGIIRPGLFQTWWPLLLIIVGLVKLFDHGGRRRSRKPYSDFGPA